MLPWWDLDDDDDLDEPIGNDGLLKEYNRE